MDIGDPHLHIPSLQKIYLQTISNSRQDKESFQVNGIQFHLCTKFPRIINHQKHLNDSNKKLKPNKNKLYLISNGCNLALKSTSSVIQRFLLHYGLFKNKLVRYKLKNESLLILAQEELVKIFQKCLARANQLKLSQDIYSKYPKYNYEEETIALNCQHFQLKKEENLPYNIQIEEFINQTAIALMKSIQVNSLRDSISMQTKEKLLQYGLMRIKYALETQMKLAFQSLLAYSQAHKQQQKYLCSMIIQHIFQTCERNRTVRADLAHFLVPYAILLRMVQVVNPFYQKSSYINQNIFYILQRMEKPFVKYQLQPTILNSYFEVITHSKTYEQLHNYLRMFMMVEYELMSTAVPYYYNFFALVINQQVYFRNGKQQPLEYTVPFSNPTIERNMVRWKHIHSAISMLERALVEKYHSNDI